MPVTEGVIIVDHGSRRAESNHMLEEVAKLFGKRFVERYAIVEAAHMELAEPSIATAYAKCVERGADRIVIAPYFLGMGKHWTRDIPSLVHQAAADFPGTSYQIAEPLMIDDLILELLYKRLTQTKEPVLYSGESDPRLDDIEPTVRREQCTSCPFEVKVDGQIVRKGV
jgi:sirohydrochlorin ferrochelatase